MTHPCVEIVIYKVLDAQKAETLRRGMRAHVAAMPGFLAWRATTATEDGNLFADIVEWQDEASAKRAGEAFQTDPQCQPFMAEIASIVSMGHFV